MMSQPAARKALMLFAKFACPPSAVAKYSLAPGARSWTISIMAVPSSSGARLPGEDDRVGRQIT